MLGPYMASAVLAITVAAPAVSYAREAVARRPRSANARQRKPMARTHQRGGLSDHRPRTGFTNSPTRQLTKT